MVFNAKDPSFRHIPGIKVLLDGQEIKLVWFADTEAGIVKTYDIFGDAKPHPVLGRPDDIQDYLTCGSPTTFAEYLIKLGKLPTDTEDVGNAWSRTLRGKVEVVMPVDGQLA